MKKKVLISTLLLIIIACVIYTFSIIVKFFKDTIECSVIQSSECFAKLINDYSNANLNLKNAMVINYADMLSDEKEYQKAVDEYDYVLSHTNLKYHKYLAKKGKEKNQKILDEIAEQEKLVNADYYDKKESYRWEKTNISIYIDSDNEQLQNTVKQAFSVYQNTFGNLFKFRYITNPKKADITVKFTEVLEDHSGNTEYHYKLYSNGMKRMYKATITIAKKNFDNDLYYNNNELINITMHEIGHALGIGNHSDSPNDIMFPKNNYRKTDLSKKDINTIKRIYKK